MCAALAGAAMEDIYIAAATGVSRWNGETDVQAPAPAAALLPAGAGALWMLSGGRAMRADGFERSRADWRMKGSAGTGSRQATLTICGFSEPGCSASAADGTAD